MMSLKSVYNLLLGIFILTMWRKLLIELRPVYEQILSIFLHEIERKVLTQFMANDYVKL